MIFIIDDDEVMAECVARAVGRRSTRIFHSAILAMAAIAEGEMPDLIFLDVMLDGPDGFTFLNEMISYIDTASVPVVVVSALELGGRDLTMYGVVRVLNKNTMRPEEIRSYAERYTDDGVACGARNNVSIREGKNQK